MLDLLLLPAALMLALGLHAVRRGEPRRHAHLMAAALALVAVRASLAFRSLPGVERSAAVGLLVCGGFTMALGRKALAWREGRSRRAALPRFHRAAGALTLILLALAAVAWMLRRAS